MAADKKVFPRYARWQAGKSRLSVVCESGRNRNRKSFPIHVENVRLVHCAAIYA